MKYKKGEGYWLGKKRIGFVPWNKGTHGLQRVLCVKCHKETDTYGTKSKKKKNNERFEYA